MIDSDEGFTLLEALVAFAIMSLVLVAVLRGGSAGVRNVEIASQTEMAVSLAQSKLSNFAAASAHAAEDLQGDDGRYHWRVQVSPLVSIPVLPIGRSQPGPTSLYQVAVTISWLSDHHPSSLRLETRRLTPVAPIVP